MIGFFETVLGLVYQGVKYDLQGLLNFFIKNPEYDEVVNQVFVYKGTKNIFGVNIMSQYGCNSIVYKTPDGANFVDVDGPEANVDALDIIYNHPDLERYEVPDENITNQVE